MITLSPTARQQIVALRRHYEIMERPAAIRNLATVIDRAVERIHAAPGRGLPAPRPYPTFIRPGWWWIKEGAYWVAYVPVEDGAIVAGIFHERADIPNRV